jgi:hypothetical protein
VEGLVALPLGAVLQVGRSMPAFCYSCEDHTHSHTHASAQYLLKVRLDLDILETLLKKSD